jgi:ABC-type nitrate/sulfonate/bicarbonate transport system ATPase subunit
MQFRVEIENVLPVSNLVFEIDLSQHGIHCIVGKNGAGKTTLAKAIMNLALADTFVRTSSDGVFNDSSAIRYTLGAEQYLFSYDPALRSISTRQPVLAHHKAVVSVEMPAPHGQRFTFFRILADQDEDIRQAVVLGRYEKPTELIEFLTNIYQDHRFDDLVQVQLRRGVCCCFVYEDKRYLREDYFSSGEYFLINLYRKITQGTPLVVIDEIDISLDASTQARLAEQLRQLCTKNSSSVVFTSHSLALMQTLEPGEIHYLDRDRDTGATTLTPMSFNGVKSLMFGFMGHDRYILTEDEILEQFLQYTINRYCSPTFYSYQIICAGGQGYVKALMNLNDQYKFYGPKENVVCILDGDQSGQAHPKQVFCLPLKNVENALWQLYQEDDFPFKFEGGDNYHPKALHKQLTKSRKLLSSEEIYKLLCDRHDNDMQQFALTLSGFLCRPGG